MICWLINKPNKDNKFMFLLLFIIKPTARDIACDVFNGPSEFWNDFNKSQKRY